MQCGRAYNPYGPYEIVGISAEETMGTRWGWWGLNVGNVVPEPGFVFKVILAGNNEFGA